MQYDHVFNLILGSDIRAGAYRVRISTEGHIVGDDGQVVATIAPWPFYTEDEFRALVKTEEEEDDEEGDDELGASKDPD